VEQGRRDVNHSHQKNNLIQDSVENGYPVLDLNKTMINVTHKKKIKEEIWKETFE
jgi:hypothetical protein